MPVNPEILKGTEFEGLTLIEFEVYREIFNCIYIRSIGITTDIYSNRFSLLCSFLPSDQDWVLIQIWRDAKDFSEEVLAQFSRFDVIHRDITKMLAR